MAANFTVVVKFKAREIENEIGQNLQMEFCVNTADNWNSKKGFILQIHSYSESRILQNLNIYAFHIHVHIYVWRQNLEFG